MKIQNIILFFAFLCYMSFFMSCNNDINGDEKIRVERQLVVRSVGLHEETGHILCMRSSRSVSVESGSMGLFLLSSVDYNAQSNIKYTYNSANSGWEAASGIAPVYLYSKGASLCAYYPYNESVGDDPSGIVLKSQLYDSEKDLCYSLSKTVSSDSTDISFNMVRAYSKITLNINHDPSYEGSCKVENISISNDKILTSNTLDITQSSETGGNSGIYGPGTLGTVSVNPGISSTSSGSSSSAVILLVPSVSFLSGYINFSFTVDGRILSARIPVSSLGGKVDEYKFMPGYNYIIDVNISGSGLSLAVDDVEGTGVQHMNAASPSNCYMVAPGDSILVHMNIKGNGDKNAVAGTGLSVTHKAYSAGLLWQTYYNSGNNEGLIKLKDFDPANQTVKVIANASVYGNAVIAAYDRDGNTILWSWHIWVTDYNPDRTPVENGDIYTIEKTNGSYIWMDRNLGATSIMPETLGVMGLLYQWGRKDPFPGANNYYLSEDDVYASLPIYNKEGIVLTEEGGTSGTGIKNEVAVSTISDKTLNLKNSIKKPMTFYLGIYGSSIGSDWYTISNTSDRQYQNDELWGGANTASCTDKTIFDPCPSGWRVSAWNGNSPWSSFNESTFIWADSDYGYKYNGGTFYPGPGYRHCSSGALFGVGSSGAYWSASIHDKYSYGLNFIGNRFFTARDNNRAYGNSVRCVRIVY